MVVEANLFARIVRVFKSYANQIGELVCCGLRLRVGDSHTPTHPPGIAVSAAEDPEKILETVVTEMQEDLIKMRQASAQVRWAPALNGVVPPA